MIFSKILGVLEISKGILLHTRFPILDQCLYFRILQCTYKSKKNCAKWACSFHEHFLQHCGSTDFPINSSHSKYAVTEGKHGIECSIYYVNNWQINKLQRNKVNKSKASTAIFIRTSAFWNCVHVCRRVHKRQLLKISWDMLSVKWEIRSSEYL